MTMMIGHQVVAPSQMAGAGRGMRMKQVFPFDCDMEVSQRLVEASHSGDIRLVKECLANPNVDVNFSGVVWLRERNPEILLREEIADEIVLKTEVSALFLAAHNGNRDLVCILLNAGADVNQQLFRGFPTAASVRQGKTEILRLLVKSGASQSACEEALLEACCHNRAELVELLMSSELIRDHSAIHALVLACTRGFIEIVGILIKHGVDMNRTARILLRSLKPTMYTNVDCTGLISSIVGRHVPVVRLLLQAGAKMNTKVSLGAWSWDIGTGEEFRVGVGLSDPYGPTWCAVEYFESTGTILRTLLKHTSVNDTYHGRSLLHHAILCSNDGAVSVLLDSGADFEMPVRITGNVEFRPIHMAARLGSCRILEILIDSGCEIDSRTGSGDTSVMECARYKRGDCLKALLIAGADLGLINSSGAFTASIANSNRWDREFQQVVIDVILSGKFVKSSNHSVFSPLMFLSRCGDVKALKALMKNPNVDLNEQDENGYSGVMVAAKEGHVNAFRFLAFYGADLNLRNNLGESAITISLTNKTNKDAFEKAILEYALDNDISSTGSFYPLHCASRRGDVAAVCRLTRGVGIGSDSDVNNLDENDFTPLMLAARQGDVEMCSLLISIGARCDIKTSRGETALSLARTSKKISNSAENVILNELSRVFVLKGGEVKKHTNGGRGLPHRKMLRMVGKVLRWGRSNKRNIICKDAEVGSSVAFQRCRRKRRKIKEEDNDAVSDDDDRGIFRVISSKNREVHFECEGGVEVAEMWVRGIRLLGNQHY